MELHCLPTVSIRSPVISNINIAPFSVRYANTRTYIRSIYTRVYRIRETNAIATITPRGERKSRLFFSPLNVSGAVDEHSLTTLFLRRRLLFSFRFSKTLPARSLPKPPPRSNDIRAQVRFRKTNEKTFPRTFAVSVFETCIKRANSPRKNDNRQFTGASIFKPLLPYR